MACCMIMATSHYLNQCWLVISRALRCSLIGNNTGNALERMPSRCGWNLVASCGKAKLRGPTEGIANNVCTRVTNCSSAHERVLLVFISRSNEVNKHHNNTRVSSETVRHESSCIIILILTRHNDDKNDDKNADLHTSTPCLTRCLTRWVYVLLMSS